MKEEHIIKGSEDRPILIDHRDNEGLQATPVIIFCHGFKGFKDFGSFDMAAEWFSKNGFNYVKFNFSHNGTDPDHPQEFTQLEAFACNTFSYELNDLGKVIDWVVSMAEKEKKGIWDAEKIYLIGHSRGGGIVILKANEDLRIKKLVTWASVSAFGRFWPEEVMKKWGEDGVRYEKNARTGQLMPMYYSLYEDLEKNEARLDIPAAVKNLKIPFLVVHGSVDESVSVKAAYEMKELNGSLQLYIEEGAGHTFGMVHPQKETSITDPFRQVMEVTLKFLTD